MSWNKFILLFVLLVLPFGPAGADDITYPTAPLAIATHDGTLHYTVEVATSPVQQEHGLMFRKSLANTHGMIFVFPTPRHTAFWMKNTFIPLDMIFVDNKGIITQIVANAKPESLDPIPSLGEVRAVIEVAGGTTAHYHIAPGDKVIYSLFP